MMSLRRTWICFLALSIFPLGILIAPPAAAQDYPNQTVKIIVPFTAGGGVDVAARIIAPKLGEELGQSVIIENRGGAGGMLGATAVAQAPPDGYTLLVGTGSTHGTNSNVYSRINYDPVRDFVPVVLLTTSPLLLIVPPSLPVKNVSDLIALDAVARASSASAPTAPAASIISAPSCSTPWRKFRPTTCPIAAPLPQ